MEPDILPDLLAEIQKDFDERTYNSKTLKKAIQSLADKKATYLDVNEFAIEIGKILSEVFKLHVTADILPDGKMYFNIAERLLNATLKKNHELITSFGVDVQTLLNQAVGIRIKAQAPKINKNRVGGLVNKISSAPIFDDVKWVLEEPIINFSQNVADAMLKSNVEFHAEAGLDPKIKRTVSGHKPCDFCKRLAGLHDYDSGNGDGIYTRHERCRCTIEYIPERGKRELVSSSKYKQNKIAEKEREKIEARKKIGIKEKE